MAGAPSSAGSGRASRQRPLAEINIPPLVAVMLVLLSFSLVATPMLEKGIPLELPATNTATEISPTQLIVSLDREGRLRINETPVHVELLETRMRAYAQRNPKETVYLRADKFIPYGEVLLVMDRIRKAGVTKVALVTVPMETPAPAR